MELTESGIVKVSVAIPEDFKAIYRHRTVLDIAGGDPQELWIIGYAYRASDGPSAVLSYLYQDGHVEVQQDVRDIELFDVEQP